MDHLPNPNEFTPGLPIKAHWFAEIVRELRKNFHVSEPLVMHTTPTGITLSLGKSVLNDVITLKNDSMGDSVPAYAVVSVKGVVDSSRRVLVEKPSEGPASYLVNGPGEIPGGGGGYAQTTELLVVSYDPSATPSPGDLYGPIPDQWYCGPDTALPIFQVLGVVDESRKVLLARMVQPQEAPGTPFRNDHDSETVPVRGIMRIVGVEEADGSQRLVCTQINNTTPEPRLYAPILHAVNIGGEVEPDGTGTCVLAKDPSHWPLRIAYDPQSHPNDPELGWFVGPGGTGTSAGSWKVTFGAPGFRVLAYDPDENEEDEEHTPAPFVIVEPVEDIDLKIRARYSHAGQSAAAAPPFSQATGTFTLTGSSSFRGGESTLSAVVQGLLDSDPGIFGGLNVFNGPHEIPSLSNPAFLAETAIAKPHVARLAMPSGSGGFGVGLTGLICGPIPEGTEEYEQYDSSTRAPQLYLGLPGYRIISTFTKENDSDTYGLVWVIADNSPTWFVAKNDISIGSFADLDNQKWTSLRCIPLQTMSPLARQFTLTPSGGSLIPYDGSSMLLPSIEVDVWYPVTNWMYPNVREGQMLTAMKVRHGIYGNGPVVWIPADSSYVDAQIGTIKIWNGAGKPVPAGWALCDGSNGTVDLRARFIVGHKSGDADHGTAWGTGGSKSHTHTAHGTTTVQSGSGAGVLADTNNHSSTDVLPPFMNVVFIQRVS